MDGRLPAAPRARPACTPAPSRALASRLHVHRLSLPPLSRLFPLLGIPDNFLPQIRRLLPVLALLAMAAVAVAQVDERPPPAEGTPLEPSNCYRCHGSGIGMGLTSMYSISARSTTPELNQPLQLTVTARNDWVADLRDLSARIDLGGAPDVGFSGRPPPVLGTTAVGNLTFDPINPLDLTHERAARVEMPLPAGATAFRIRLLPDVQEGEEAPDLQLRLWAPASDTRGDPTLVEDRSGKGGLEMLLVDEATNARRSGTWLAEVAQAACTEIRDRSCLRDQGFRLVGDAWFNITGGARAQTQPFPVGLDGQDLDAPQRSSVSWTLFIRQEPEGNQTITVTVNTTAHFKHDHNSARYDDWPFSQQITLPIALHATMELQAAPAPLAPASDEGLIPWIEAIGYASAFALVASVVSGGIFGKSSKRLLDRLFGRTRRRVAFHIAISYVVTLLAMAHTILFVVEATYHWGVGLLWGGLATLSMILVGVNGALQMPVIRRWGYPVWKVLNSVFTYALLVFLVLHVALDGVHFSRIPERLGWRDPVLEYLRG